MQQPVPDRPISVFSPPVVAIVTIFFPLPTEAADFRTGEGLIVACETGR
ncbi:hypothetical protein H6G52_07655 [Limnothrix sp. FACHB-881]|nr:MULTISPECIES: hypothetical protein [unclassified Limnothrix]MBD2161243.1 hypothetical protein [Limnothrix sp. FACHB-1083]MBD2192393.1 hypothetical protein [Limnothrix sp. FACHB-1088]MBD2590097.1 hypothetical protein [Limnothrix sp. FACHB-406]MBD2635229.1 hypothetical protein [Limnothrix sp. FACHB-881]